MKQSPEMDRIEREMRPGVITRDGFLGTDTRRLQDILIADDATVKRLDLTHERIAEGMRALRDAGRVGLGEPIQIHGRYDVQVDSVRGVLPCPFLDGCVLPKLNTAVRDLENGRALVFTDLNIHMIEAHGFYEGKGSPFRLEPAELVALLDLAADTK